MFIGVILSFLSFGVLLDIPDAQHYRIHGMIDVNSARSERLLIPYFNPDDAKRHEERLAWFKRRKREEINKRRKAEAYRHRQQQLAKAGGGLILAGILDLPRLRETGPVDGCAKVNKGLLNDGGFMVFTCEKLLAQYPIKHQYVAMDRYKGELLKAGWRHAKAEDSRADNQSFRRRDSYGCNQTLRLTLWSDRAMNEPPAPVHARDKFRQIVFLTRFNGSACERYYPIVQALAAP